MEAAPDWPKKLICVRSLAFLAAVDRIHIYFNNFSQCNTEQPGSKPELRNPRGDCVFVVFLLEKALVAPLFLSAVFCFFFLLLGKLHFLQTCFCLMKPKVTDVAPASQSHVFSFFSFFMLHVADARSDAAGRK